MREAVIAEQISTISQQELNVKSTAPEGMQSSLSSGLVGRVAKAEFSLSKTAFGTALAFSPSKISNGNLAGSQYDDEEERQNMYD